MPESALLIVPTNQITNPGSPELLFEAVLNVARFSRFLKSNFPIQCNPNFFDTVSSHSNHLEDSSQFSLAGQLSSLSSKKKPYINSKEFELSFKIVKDAECADSSRHTEEFRQSAIAPEIVELNFKTADEAELLERLLYSLEIKRTNTGRVPENILRKYQHLKDGGWICNSLDPESNWQRSMNFCSVKPNTPRITTKPYKGFGQPQKPKEIRYESPYHAPYRILYLRVTFRISKSIAEKAGFSAEFCQRFQENENPDPDAEDKDFWLWVSSISNFPILLTEGAKKTAALLSSGYCAIGLVGIWMGCIRTKDSFKLHPDLAIMANYHRPFSVCFDRDKKLKTQADVWQATIRLISYIKKLKRENKSKSSCLSIGESLTALQPGKDFILNLPGPEKGVDDYIFSQSVLAFDQVYEERIIFEVAKVLKFRQLTQLPDLKLHQRYLEDFGALSNKKWIAIRSAKGTGKTESLISMVAQAQAAGKPTLLITHRIQLGETLANRLGIPFISCLGGQGQMLGFGFCVDSMRPSSRAGFKGAEWSNAIVIIDEVEQVIDHLLNSSTEVKKYRPEILMEFSNLLSEILDPESEGQLYTLDADLCDISIAFIRNHSRHPENKPYLVVNNFSTSTNQSATFYEEVAPYELVSDAIKQVKNGGRIFFATSGQKESSTFGTINLEEQFKQECTNKKIIRIDSTTISDPTHPAYKAADSINLLVLQYDVVIISPTLGTGISIDCEGHFTAKFGIFSGNTSADSARQALARIREDLPIYIWASDRTSSIFQTGNGSKSAIGLIRGQSKEAELNLRRWEEFSLVNDDVNGIVNSAPLEAWARIGAAHNSELLCYRELIKQGLKEEGFKIRESFFEKNEVLKAKAKSIKEKSQESFCRRVANSEPFYSEAEYKKSKKKETKTQLERERELHYEMEKRYQVLVTPELVASTQDFAWPKQIETHYYLTKGRAFLKKRDELRGQSIIQDGAVFLPDLNRSQLSNRVKALSYLGIDKLISQLAGDETICNDDGVILSIFDKAITNQANLRLIGINIPTKYPIAAVNSLFKLIGLNLEKIGKQEYRLRKEATTIDPKTGETKHKKNALLDGRIEIFERWFERDSGQIVNVEEYQLQKQPEYPRDKCSSFFSQLKKFGQIPCIYIEDKFVQKICSFSDMGRGISATSQDLLQIRENLMPLSNKVIRLVETISDATSVYPSGTQGKLLHKQDGLIEVLLEGFESPIKLFPEDVEEIPRFA